MSRYYPYKPEFKNYQNPFSSEGILVFSVVSALISTFIALIVCMCNWPSEHPIVTPVLLGTPITVCILWNLIGFTYHYPRKFKDWLEFRKTLKSYNKTIAELDVKYNREEAEQFVKQLRK